MRQKRHTFFILRLRETVNAKKKESSKEHFTFLPRGSLNRIDCLVGGRDESERWKGGNAIKREKCEES